MLLKLVFEENSGALSGPAGRIVIVVMFLDDVKLWVLLRANQFVHWRLAYVSTMPNSLMWCVEDNFWSLLSDGLLWRKSWLLPLLTCEEDCVVLPVWDHSVIRRSRTLDTCFIELSFDLNGLQRCTIGLRIDSVRAGASARSCCRKSWKENSATSLAYELAVVSRGVPLGVENDWSFLDRAHFIFLSVERLSICSLCSFFLNRLHKSLWHFDRVCDPVKIAVKVTLRPGSIQVFQTCTKICRCHQMEVVWVITRHLF